MSTLSKRGFKFIKGKKGFLCNISLFFTGERNELREYFFSFYTLSFRCSYFYHYLIHRVIITYYFITELYQLSNSNSKKEKIIDFPRLNPGINPKQPLHLVDRRIIKSRSTGIVQLSNLGRDRRPCL